MSKRRPCARLARRFLLNSLRQHTFAWSDHRRRSSARPTGPASQRLEYTEFTLSWWRGGTSPEILRATVEHSNDGLTWTDLGAGMRVNGGWQWTNFALPTTGLTRIRGHVVGDDNGWFVETALGDQRIHWANGDAEIILKLLPSVLQGQVTVEASSDLSDWKPFTTISYAAGPIYFLDPPTRTQRFYRAKFVP